MMARDPTEKLCFSTDGLVSVFSLWFFLCFVLFFVVFSTALKSVPLLHQFFSISSGFGSLLAVAECPTALKECKWWSG